MEKIGSDLHAGLDGQRLIKISIFLHAQKCEEKYLAVRNKLDRNQKHRYLWFRKKAKSSRIIRIIDTADSFHIYRHLFSRKEIKSLAIPNYHLFVEHMKILIVSVVQ